MPSGRTRDDLAFDLDGFAEIAALAGGKSSLLIVSPRGIGVALCMHILFLALLFKAFPANGDFSV